MQWPPKLFWSFFLFLLCILMQGCAAKPYLDMTYRLPVPSAVQMGNKTCIIVKDNRKAPEILEPSAQKAFNNFSGFFNLTVLSTDKKSAHYGNVELEILFKRAMVERLQNMGVEILDSCTESQPTMRVVIKRFKINLTNHKWKADVAYEASLTIDGKNIVKESVAGKAERVKLVGSKAAQTVIGELFSDMINRLDINRLFDQLMR